MPVRRLILLGLAASLLAGCNIMSRQTGDIRQVPVNTGAALAQVNAYRAANGLHRLSVDPRLNAASADMALLMACRDTFNPRAHNSGSLSRRVASAGMQTFAGAENLGSGYTSFGHAMDGWKGSSDHRKSLLNKHVTRVGFTQCHAVGRKMAQFLGDDPRPPGRGRPADTVSRRNTGLWQTNSLKTACVAAGSAQFAFPQKAV